MNTQALSASWQALIANPDLSALPEWLKNWRQQQLQQFIAQGFPARHNEDWKYTNLRKIAEQNFQSQSIVVTPDIKPYLISEFYCLIFINGQLRLDLSDLPQEITVVDKVQALQKYSEHYKKLLQIPNPSPLAALNAGLAEQGALVVVPDNCQLAKPLHILHISNDLPVACLQQTQQLISVGENSEITILEEYCGDASNYFNNIVTNIEIAANASLKLFKLQREGDNASHIASTVIQQQNDSRVTSFSLSLGANLARDDLQVNLLAKGTECNLLGLYQLAGKQYIDHHTCINHSVGQTRSQQHYRGIIADQSQAVFNGKVIVHPDAKQSSAEQLNKNLLLSQQAEIDTKPELEIYNDDVKCSHGATVGELNQTALFYLRSRGIDEKLARQLLIRGFATELLEHLPANSLGEHIENRVLQTLNKLAGE
ncbi:MAG: Fe-S cluster assembly protein SufD [Gammaproteobacteria bacterium]|nr:Fe-S cluster assembly protein SufD [Gammaproteobacteria bacterium]